MSDARAYLAYLLRHRVADADVNEAVDLLLAKSEALFLYLDFVRARLAMVRPDAPATLGDGSSRDKPMVLGDDDDWSTIGAPPLKSS